MFKTTLIFFVFFLVGCTCTPEREAHKVMANRHFPALIEYYKGDSSKSDLFRQVLVKSVEEWNKLIQSR